MLMTSLPGPLVVTRFRFDTLDYLRLNLSPTIVFVPGGGVGVLMGGR